MPAEISATIRNYTAESRSGNPQKGLSSWIASQVEDALKGRVVKSADLGIVALCIPAIEVESRGISADAAARTKSLQDLPPSDPRAAAILAEAMKSPVIDRLRVSSEEAADALVSYMQDSKAFAALFRGVTTDFALSEWAQHSKVYPGSPQTWNRVAAQRPTSGGQYVQLMEAAVKFFTPSLDHISLCRAALGMRTGTPKAPSPAYVRRILDDATAAGLKTDDPLVASTLSSLVLLSTKSLLLDGVRDLNKRISRAISGNDRRIADLDFDAVIALADPSRLLGIYGRVTSAAASHSKTSSDLFSNSEVRALTGTLTLLRPSALDDYPARLEDELLSNVRRRSFEVLKHGTGREVFEHAARVTLSFPSLASPLALPAELRDIHGGFRGTSPFVAQAFGFLPLNEAMALLKKARNDCPVPLPQLFEEELASVKEKLTQVCATPISTTRRNALKSVEAVLDGAPRDLLDDLDPATIARRLDEKYQAHVQFCRERIGQAFRESDSERIIMIADITAKNPFGDRELVIIRTRIPNARMAGGVENDSHFRRPDDIRRLINSGKWVPHEDKPSAIAALLPADQRLVSNQKTAENIIRANRYLAPLQGREYIDTLRNNEHITLGSLHEPGKMEMKRTCAHNRHSEKPTFRTVRLLANVVQVAAKIQSGQWVAAGTSSEATT